MNENKRKKILMEIDSILNCISATKDGNNSGYTRTNKLVEAAKDSVLNNPRKALRYLKKAENITLKESRLVARFHTISTLVSNEESAADRSVRSMMSKYSRAIESGNLRAADKQLCSLEKEMRLRGIALPLDISISKSVVTKEDTVTIAVNNNTDGSVIVQSISATSTGADVKVKCIASNIPSRGQGTYPMEMKSFSEGVAVVIVNLEFEAKLKRRSQRESFTLRVIPDETDDQIDGDHS